MIFLEIDMGREKDRIESDSEFPWIKLNWTQFTIKCSRCGEESPMFNSWTKFLDKHEYCKEKILNNNDK